MTNLWLILSIVGMFLVRIGIPLLLMILVGVLIEKWQRQSEAEVRRYYDTHNQLPEGSA